MRAPKLFAMAVVSTLLGVTSCSDAGLSEQDAYKIGCPAIDTVVAGGAMGSKAAVAGLEKLREQPSLSPQTQEWLDAAIAALATTDPNDMPAGAKRVLIDGCAGNGYPLRNLDR